MAKFLPLQVNFAAGELSPDVLARIDLEAFSAGAALMENFISLPQGPFYRRGGFVHKDEMIGKMGRAVGLPVSSTQAFVVIFPKPDTGATIHVYDVENGTVTDTTISNPYAEGDLHELQFAMAPGGNVLYIAHREYQPRTLTYTVSTDTWALATITFTSKPANWTGTNWPGVVCFHQGRSWWGGAPDEPETFIGSVSNDYIDLTTGPDPADAMSYTLANQGMIQWMVSHKKLVMGTDNAEYIVQSDGGVLIPGDVQADRQSGYGSAYRQALVVGDRILYVSSDRTKIRDMNYQWTEDGWKSREITFVSDHLFKTDPVSQIAYAPNRNLLLVITDGNDIIMATYERGNDIIGWHRHSFIGDCFTLGTVNLGGESIICGVFDRVTREDGSGNEMAEIEVYDDDTYLDSAVDLRGTSLKAEYSFEVDTSGWTALGNSTITRNSNLSQSGTRADGSWCAFIQCTADYTEDAQVRSEAITIGAGFDYEVKLCFWRIYTFNYNDLTITIQDDTLTYTYSTDVYDMQNWEVDEWTDVTVSGSIDAGHSGDIKITITVEDHLVVGMPALAAVDYIRVYKKAPTAISGKTQFAERTDVQAVIDGEVFTDIEIDSDGDGTLPESGYQVYYGLPYTSRFTSMPIARILEAGASVPVVKGIGRIYARLLSSACPKIQNKRRYVDFESYTELIEALGSGYNMDAQIEIVQDRPLATKIAGLYAEVDENVL
jgi:hypothetical protein